MGEYSQANEYCKKALVIREKISGEDHADVAVGYNNAVKPKNITKKHLWFAKRFLVKIMPM